jgi:hypothetical protein
MTGLKKNKIDMNQYALNRHFFNILNFFGLRPLRLSAASGRGFESRIARKLFILQKLLSARSLLHRLREEGKITTRRHVKIQRQRLQKHILYFS